MQTTIIIPCYNEEKRLPANVFSSFARKNKDIRFLFINNGSTDRTIEVLRKLMAQDEHFLILDLQNNEGKAEAVRQGMLYALENVNSEYVGFWDADLATPLNEIDRFFDCFRTNNCKMVMGCRLMRLGSNVKRKNTRHYLGRIFATVASVVLKLKVYDTQCGAKLFKTNIVLPLFDKPFISRWLFDVELLARYIKTFGLEDANKNIYEYPLASWEDVAGSSIKIIDFFKAPIELWKIKRKYLNN